VAGCDEVFIDKASGKLARRPELDRALLSANRMGDQLVITKLDRVGRSLEHLIELSNDLQARGVDLGAPKGPEQPSTTPAEHDLCSRSGVVAWLVLRATDS